jgi:hypothetical protein
VFAAAREMKFEMYSEIKTGKALSYWNGKGIKEM